MDKKRLLCVIAALLAAVTAAGADNYTIELLDNATYDRVKARLDNVTIDNATRAKAQKIVNAYLGKEGIKLINRRMAEISGKLNMYSAADNLTTDAADTDIAATAAMLVFISSSMPMDTLKTYIASAGRDTVFVLRGTVGSPNKIAPTINFIKEMLCDKAMNCTEASIIINPDLFKQYGVERAPTVVVRVGGDDYRFVGAMPLKYIQEKAEGAEGIK
jgi:type-F conjugative transfer system pilin assembly protein TrbC